MRWSSSRGGEAATDFLTAVGRGLPADGGVYVPHAWPALTSEEIGRLAGRPFADTLVAVLRRFVGEALRRQDVEEIASEVAAGFPGPVLPSLVQLGPRLWLADASVGPTGAAHDLTTLLTARLLDRTGARAPKALVVIGGDDRGEAAMAALGGPARRLAVFFAEADDQTDRRIAAGQGKRRKAYVLMGSADTSHRAARLLARNSALRDELGLGLVVGQSPAELAARTALLFGAAVALGAPGRTVSFALTGDWSGAALAARRLGLPIGRTLIAATPDDGRLSALSNGLYRESAAEDFERLYFESCGRDARETARAAQAIGGGATLPIPPSALAALRELFDGRAVDAETARRMLLSLYRQTGRLLDPEAAIGCAAAERPATASGPIVVVGLRHPSRAAGAVHAACGVVPEPPPSLKPPASAQARCERLAPYATAIEQALRTYVQEAAA